MKTTFLAGIAMLCPLATWAADITPFDVKVGLWETTMSTNISGMPAMPSMPQIPPEALARMPPQQRAQMEAMMKARGGSAIPSATRVCLTRESLNAGALGQRDKSCTSKVISSSASKQVLQVECNQEEVKTTGEMTVERVDPEHIKGTMVMKSSAGGVGRDVKMSFDTKWVAADCGNVKPVIAK